MSAARPRLSSAVFRLPVERIREGYYSDQYFNLDQAAARGATTITPGC